MADFWLPQRGVFAIGTSFFKPAQANDSDGRDELIPAAADLFTTRNPPPSDQAPRLLRNSAGGCSMFSPRDRWVPHNQARRDDLLLDISNLVDTDKLRADVRTKYREVAENPSADYHFHTGRAHALRMGYPTSPLDQLPDAACEAFAGVANPFHWDHPREGERVVDLGSGAGMDTFLASIWVGPTGSVIGVDMTPEMLARSRDVAARVGFGNVEFREGVIEDVPVDDSWADVVISNGVINLCPDKLGVYREIHRILKPGGRMMIADICVQKPVPESALRDIDLWTG